MRNASSSLLKLPPEIRNRIYFFVHSGHFLHVGADKYNHRHFLLYLYRCKSGFLEQEEQGKFVPGVHLAVSPSESYWQHRVAKRNLWCVWGIQKRPWFSGPASELTNLSITSLHACRQVYHEAKYILYSTNTFSFETPDVLDRFRNRMGEDEDGRNWAICRVHLDMVMFNSSDTASWTNSLQDVVHRFHCLHKVDISAGLFKTGPFPV